MNVVTKHSASLNLGTSTRAKVCADALSVDAFVYWNIFGAMQGGIAPLSGATVWAL
jgi:hypothetical protein